jgi:hypothetical protein
MKNSTLMLLVTITVCLAAGCATAPAPALTPLLEPGTPVLIEASPALGFHYPYLLQIPKGKPVAATRLLVEPNNTGAISDDPAVHLEAAQRLARNALGASMAARLEVPLLVPVFPRPEKDWKIYTHQLDRDSMRITSGPMRRLDLQLIAMIEDAQRRLRAAGIDVGDDVLMTGFSASGTFANRFTMLHPKRVRAVATGGLNGLLMVPAAAIGPVALPYPIGTADVKALTGKTVDLAAWRRVPQFIYMGALDDNDALQFDDGYDDDERAIVFPVLGERMQPDRWLRVQEIYRDAGANAVLKTYEGIGHATDRRIADELAEFFHSHL